MAGSEVVRSIGVTGVVVTLVGLVLGPSIFILPGALAATAGPGVVLSYGIAAVMAVFSCFVAAQIGAVFPTSGASFVAVSRLIAPATGFAAVWLIIGGASVAAALVAYVFADYALLVAPGLDRMALAVLIVAALAGINLLGVRAAVVGQGFMVAASLGALAVFCTAAWFALDLSRLAPLMPNGLGPVLAAAVPAAFSFAGFMVVIEIGGEVKRPSRTMPIALAISFIVSLLVCIAVSLAIVGVIPWSELNRVGAPVGEAAARILPSWTTGGITLAVLAASAGAINALLLGYSRDLLVLARVKAIPAVFARVSRKRGEPVYGVLLITALSLAAVAVGGTIEQFATLVVVALLALQIALGVAALLIPSRLPDRYRGAEFRLRPGPLRFLGTGLIVLSGGFLVIAVWHDLRVVLVAAAWLLVGVAYYAIRRSALVRRGVDMEVEIRRQLDDTAPSSCAVDPR